MSLEQVFRSPFVQSQISKWTNEGLEDIKESGTVSRELKGFLNMLHEQLVPEDTSSKKDYVKKLAAMIKTNMPNENSQELKIFFQYLDSIAKLHDALLSHMLKKGLVNSEEQAIRFRVKNSLETSVQATFKQVSELAKVLLRACEEAFNNPPVGLSFNLGVFAPAADKDTILKTAQREFKQDNRFIDHRCSI